MRKDKELYERFTKLIREAKEAFLYLCIDELYRFVGEKRNRVYVWTAVGVIKRIKSGRKFYFYSLSKGFRSSVSVQFGVTESGEILHRWARWV
jgi:hypothetical protein